MTSTGNSSKWIWLLLALFVGPLAFAQDTGKLKGKVADNTTKETLIGATVVLVGTYKGAVCDIDGNFVIDDIKPGDYSVKVTFVGYSDKIYNGITIEKGKTKTLNITLSSRATAIDEVVIVGEANLVDLEGANSQVTISQEDIRQMNVRDVKEVVAMQAGVTEGPDGLQIRGARVYETTYLVDGISAQDPLAGTGFGVEVSSSSIGDVKVITGGQGAEFGDGSSGVISTKIREGSKKLEVGGSWQRDNLGFDKNTGTAWNTDIMEFSLAGPVPFTKKKITFFNNVSATLTDNYFRKQADQLHSSLFPSNDSIWAPRQDNKWSHTFKLAYQVKPGTKITLTNQHSLMVNQNTRSLQIVGFDAILQPGFQYLRSNNLDNASTYTHHSNLTAANLNHFFSNKLNLNLSVGRLFTKLRADANGRPFREETVDQILDEQSIVTDPIGIFNPGAQVGFVLPPSGFINNGGISSLWHDHYVEEYTIKNKFNYYPNNKIHRIAFGFEHKITEYQWVDVTAPWVGAPIQINENLSTPSISIGSSNDIWKVNPHNGGLFVQDVLSYKGIEATLGLRFNYWAPGRFVDDAVDNPDAAVVDQVRTDYENNTIGLMGLRWKTRFLPKVNVSFPVTENNVLYFNYGHSMRLPHPRFLYAGLDPDFQDRSFLSNLGNPDLNPEVNVSYEVGLKSQITKDFGVTVSAFNNNRFDYIVSRRVIINDQTGRPTSRTMFINQDYAKIAGVELGLFNRIGKHLKTFLNVTYQVARGKSNSARESGLQIEQTGEVELAREQFLAFDRPLDIKGGVTFTPDSSLRLAGVSLKHFRMFLSGTFKSGLRYTPQEQVDENAFGRPLFEVQNDRLLQEIGSNWFWLDFKFSRDFVMKDNRGFTLSIEIRNVLDNRNAQIINPITGRAYEPGDDVPLGFKDPRFNDPLDYGEPMENPARYLPPRQLLYGISFRF